MMLATMAQEEPLHEKRHGEATRRDRKGGMLETFSNTSPISDVIVLFPVIRHHCIIFSWELESKPSCESAPWFVRLNCTSTKLFVATSP